MDTAQWPQGIGVVKTVESSKPINGGTDQQKKPRPDKDQPVNCPRCNSTNTKFCYYNNYSLTQPRYFCKTCRRYWTAGGSLRNVPVGGGSRKNKRSSSSTSSSSAAAANSNIISSKKIATDHNLAPPIFSPQNPKIGHDLNLAYNQYVTNLPFGLGAKNFSLQNLQNLHNPINASSSSSRDDHQHLPMMEFLKSGNLMSSFMNSSNNNNNMNIPVSGDSNPVFSSTGFGVHDYKPSLGFSLDGIDQNGYGNNVQLGLEDHHHNHHDTDPSTILFPFEELKPVSTTHDAFDQEDNNDNNRGQNGEIANGYWNGMLAGGSW